MHVRMCTSPPLRCNTTAHVFLSAHTQLVGAFRGRTGVYVCVFLGVSVDVVVSQKNKGLLPGLGTLAHVFLACGLEGSSAHQQVIAGWDGASYAGHAGLWLLVLYFVMSHPGRSVLGCTWLCTGVYLIVYCSILWFVGMAVVGRVPWQ